MAEASDGSAAAQASALRLLARREYSAAELRDRLIRRFPSVAHVLVDDLLDQLREQGLQSDSRFAESRVRSRLHKGYGPAYIRQDLMARGIDANLAAASIARVVAEEEVDWLDLARRLVERRHPDAGEERRNGERAARYLQRRGFPGEVIARLLRD